MNEKTKRLYRSSGNRIFAGIFGGLGDYFDVDPVMLRVVAVFALFITGFFPLFFSYIIACFIVPEKSTKVNEEQAK